MSWFNRVFLNGAILSLAVLIPASAIKDPFADVGLLQKAVAPVLPIADWREVKGVGYTGSAQIEEPGFVLSYAMIGKDRARVDRLNISTLIHAVKPGPELSRARAKLELATIQWFKSVGLPLPRRLLLAIRQGQEISAVTDRMLVECINQGSDQIVRLQPKR